MQTTKTSYHHHDRTTKKPVVFEILGGNNTEFHLCFLTFYLLPGHLENQKLQFSIRERDVEAVKADCDIPALARLQVFRWPEDLMKNALP